MLSDNDILLIKKTAEQRLEQDCAFFNHEIDQSRLLDAIAKAIAEAIRQYDQMR